MILVALPIPAPADLVSLKFQPFQLDELDCLDTVSSMTRAATRSQEPGIRWNVIAKQHVVGF